MIEKYEGFIFDLDGTIYRGSHLIPNAEKTVNHIKASGKELIFISNKTTGSVNDYYKFLLAQGLKIEEHEIVNSRSLGHQTTRVYLYLSLPYTD